VPTITLTVPSSSKAILAASRGVAHGRLDVIRQAHAASHAARRGFRPAPVEPRPVRFLQGGIHDAGEVAGIVGLAGRGLERHGG
jgi:hypothetical protein